MRSVTNSSAAPSRLERVLSRVLGLFAKVEPKEVASASVMTFVAFVLMCGYYLLKTAREPLILLQWGAEAKIYAEAAQAVILLGVVRVYGVIARRVGRMRLLSIVYLFFASNMVAFAALSMTRLQIGLAFFLWVGISSIAQFWAFAAGHLHGGARQAPLRNRRHRKLGGLRCRSRGGRSARAFGAPDADARGCRTRHGLRWAAQVGRTALSIIR